MCEIVQKGTDPFCIIFNVYYGGAFGFAEGYACLFHYHSVRWGQFWGHSGRIGLGEGTGDLVQAQTRFFFHNTAKIVKCVTMNKLGRLSAWMWELKLV